MYQSRRSGLVPPDPSTSDKVRDLVQSYGPSEAAKKLGLGRETCLAIGCGAQVCRGSIALVEEGIRKLTAASEDSAATLDA